MKDSIKLWDGFTPSGKPIEIWFIDNNVVFKYKSNGHWKSWNEEFYTNEDIGLIHTSLVREGYRITRTWGVYGVI